VLREFWLPAMGVLTVIVVKVAALWWVSMTRRGRDPRQVLLTDRTSQFVRFC
jgi:hypothetical protein